MFHIREAAHEAGTTMSCQVPEEMLSSLSDALRAQVEGPTPGEANAAPAIVQSNWGVRYRWIAHATVTRTRVGADPSQVVQGTSTTSSDVRRGSSAREEHTDSSTSGGHVGVSGGPSITDVGGATAEARRDGSRAHGTSGASGSEAGRSDGSSIMTRGPIELTEEQWVYHVAWSLRVEQDNQGDWSLNNTLSMIFTDPFERSGSQDIGIRSITRSDTTPPHGHARPHRPERIQ